MGHLEAVAKAIADNLTSQAEVADLPDRYADWIDPDELAAAAVAALCLPDRVFVDNLGQRWEWCGGEEGTWAWRRTADAVQLTEEWGVISDMGVERHGIPQENAEWAASKWPDMSARSRLVSPWVVQQERNQP